jgi:hypothetical protein
MGHLVTLGANRDFVLSALHTIRTAPDLAALSGALVLKGGVALALRYASDRVSRNDMDFGLTSLDHLLTQDDSDNLLAEMNDTWSTVADGPREIVVRGDGIDTPWISFVHPTTGEVGRLKLQTNSFQVPPILKTEIPTEKFETFDGQKFVFPVLAVSEIAAEKMCRIWRSDKQPPRSVDFYDIGFCSECDEYRFDDVVYVVREHRKSRSEGSLIRIKDTHPMARQVAKRVPVATTRRLAFFGPTATDDQITRLTALGLAQLEVVKQALESTRTPRKK